MGQLRKHVNYLDRSHSSGMFLASGHTVVPDADIEVVLASGDRAEIEAVAAKDPLVRAGMAEWEILTVEPERVHEELEEALAVLAGPTLTEMDTHGWDTDALRQLRAPGADLVGAFTGRSISPVLQHVGQLLLGRLAAGDVSVAAQARRCADELRERDWQGDTALARELSHALGETVDAEQDWSPRWPLQPTPVDLEDLAAFLDGDPQQGRGIVDLSTGEVWPPGVFDFGERPRELDEDNDAYDPDRWLFFWPDSREGYRDMEDFAAAVNDGGLRDRLMRALDGRGAFRRFRDVLDSAADVHLRRWYVFRDERALGRARVFLAEEGYRSAPTNTNTNTGAPAATPPDPQPPRQTTARGKQYRPPN
jgi:uncharacterized protein YciI